MYRFGSELCKERIGCIFMLSCLYLFQSVNTNQLAGKKEYQQEFLLTCLI